MDPDIVDMDHVAVRVTDLDVALAFYHDLLGMPIRDRDRYDEGEVPYVAVVAGGRHVHLVPVPEPSIDPDVDNDAPVGGDHICLLIRSNGMDTKDQLSELLAAVKAAGYEVEPDEPKKRYGAYGRDWAAYVRDPDGRRVELKIH